MLFSTLIHSFRPHPSPVKLQEKFISGLASGLAILILGLVLQYTPSGGQPLLMLGSMAASAVLVFAVPHSPLAQPWNLFGGHTISACVGWLCLVFIGNPLLAAGIAVGASIFLMHYFNCLHPPGAATAMTLVLGSSQFHTMSWQGIALVIAANTGIFLLLALIINNVFLGKHYPARLEPPTPPQPTPPQPGPFISLEQHDLEWALSQMDGVIDISEEDLASIYQLALFHARQRDAPLNQEGLPT